MFFTKVALNNYGFRCFNSIGFLLLFTVFGNACESEMKTFEKSLKEDKNRPGKVGTLRGLEVLQKATRITQKRCPDIVDSNFEGSLNTSLSIQIRKPNTKLWREVIETRELKLTPTQAQISTDKKTIDELNLLHRLRRTWTFDGKNSAIETTLGYGKIAGPRPPTTHERDRIIQAGEQTFALFRGLQNDDCATPGSKELAGKLSLFRMDVYEVTEEEAKIEWRAENNGLQVIVKYTHKKQNGKIVIQFPKITNDLKPASSGFGPADALMDTLDKVNLLEKETEETADGKVPVE